MHGMSLLIIDMLNIASDEANSSPSPTGMTVARDRAQLQVLSSGNEKIVGISAEAAAFLHGFF